MDHRCRNCWIQNLFYYLQLCYFYSNNPFILSYQHVSFNPVSCFRIVSPSWWLRPWSSSGRNCIFIRSLEIFGINHHVCLIFCFQMLSKIISLGLYLHLLYLLSSWDYFHHGWDLLSGVITLFLSSFLYHIRVVISFWFLGSEILSAVIIFYWF